MSSCWVRVGGVDGYSIGAHTAPTWETLADGGCGVASVSFTTPTRAPHNMLRQGVVFEILYGVSPIYTGVTTEFDRQSGTLHAKGLGLDLYDVLALTPAGEVTRDLGVAINQAIAAARWLGSNPLGVTGVVEGDSTEPTSIGALLDDYCQQTGQWWGADRYGRVYLQAKPTEPSWIVSPDSAVFGETNEDAPTFLAGRYDDGTGTNKTAFAGVPGKESSTDLTDRGVLTEAQAQGILEGMLARRGSVAWVNSAELTSGQITTIGGTPAFLPVVRAGQLMRSFGVGYVGFGSLALDTMIGKTTYTAGSPTIQVEPVNTAPRTAVDVWAA